MNLRYCVLADTIVRGADGKTNIIGVFSGIACKEFPAVHSKFSMTLLIEGSASEVGEHELEITFVDADYKPVGNSLKSSFSLGKGIGGQSAFADMNINAQDLLIPKAGLYEFTIKVDGRHIGSSPLSVHTLKQSIL